MNRLFLENPAAPEELAEEAKSACIRYRNRRMPPGALPEHADIGFEVDPQSGAATLFVAHGIRYSGHDDQIRQWFEAGMIEFSSFEELTQWVQGPISSTFHPPSIIPDGIPDSVRPVTDMNAVQAAIPEQKEPMYLDEDQLFEKLREKVIGQDTALRVFSGAIARHFARKHPQRPGVVFAVGPTGVGKTRSAEVLAMIIEELSDSHHTCQYVRLDMSEYQESHRVSQLLGAPQGYVGHGEGSQLIDALRANPNTIVLFDEIEKAHPDVLRAIMNAMDAGRLSSPAGENGNREIDCRHAAFIFTSNLDADGILGELESRSAFEDPMTCDEVCRRRLKASGIAPEIVGRIGRFLVYRPLSGTARAAIIALAITEVAKEYGVEVAYVEPEVIIEVMKQSRSDDFGIRPEKYLIDDMLGGCFTKAARSGITEPARILSTPYRCVPEHEIQPHETNCDQEDKPQE
jgi:hypothetical protein